MLLCLAIAWMLRDRMQPSEDLDGTRSSSSRAAHAPQEAEPSLATRPQQSSTESGVIDAKVRDPVASTQHWLQRVNGAKNKAALRAILDALAALDAQETLEVVRRIYTDVSHLNRRIFILRYFGTTRPGNEPHVHAVSILDLGTRDPLLRVQSEAFDLLARLTRLDFSEDPETYERWMKVHGGKTAQRVMGEGAVGIVGRLRDLGGEELERALRSEGVLSRWDSRYLVSLGSAQARLLIDAGARELAHLWWTDDRNASVVRAAGVQWIGALSPDAAYLREHVVPVLGAPLSYSDEVIAGAIGLLTAHGKPWAFDDLVGAFEKVPSKKQWWALARAMVAFGDLRAIPTMIGIIEADGGYDSVYGVGHVGLRALTGVSYKEEHDGAWWRAWWAANRSRFGKAGAIDIPSLRPVAR